MAARREPLHLLKSFQIPYLDVLGKEWITIECPFHNDKHADIADCHGGVHRVTGKFKCFSCSAPNQDVMSVIATVHGVTENVISAHADNILGTASPGSVDAATVELCFNELKAHDSLRNRMLSQHGITEAAIQHFRLGYHPATQRVTIPVKGLDGTFVNLRQYKYDATSDKVKGIKGGKAVLWPIEHIKEQTIYITEGEFKAVVLWVHGFNAVTGTAGAGSWNNESWSPLFKGKDVVLLLDIDEAGRNGAAKLCHYLYPYVKSIKNVFLSDVQGIPKGDITDFFVKRNLTATDLARIVAETPAYIPPSATVTKAALELNDPIEVKLGASGRAELNNKIIRTSATVSAKDTAPYIIPAKCTVVCSKDKSYCPMCKVFNTKERATFTIPEHSPEILELINSGAKAQDEVLRKASGIYQGCKVAAFQRDESHNVEEIRLIPQIAVGHSSDEQVTRKAYYIGSDTIAANNTYTFEGRVCAEPKDGHATIVMFKKEASRDDLDNFQATQPLLKFQPKEWTKESIKEKLDHIYDDLESNVTRIFRRRDLHLFYDLIWHTVLYIDFQGRRVKGWGDALVIGDSGQGKSECSSRLSTHYRSGERVDTKRASVAGLVGGLQETAKRWFITWGTIPLNDRRLVLLEEVKGMGAPELSKMTDMRSSGVAEITKIERAKTTARTRLIWITNPRSDSNISTYNYGVDAVKELMGGLEDIRRFDMVIAVASGEVPLDIVNSKHSTSTPHTYTSDLCSELITWAWSRTEAEVRVECEDALLAAAKRMGEMYSSACPIVEPSDQRMKLLRLATGLAARTFSTDDGETLIVRDCHVEVVEEFLNRIYSSKALGYKDYSDTQKSELEMVDPDAIANRLKECPNARETVRGLIEAETIKLEDITNLTEWDFAAAGEFIGFLNRKGCLRRHRRGGYRKTSAFIELLKTLDRSGLASETLIDQVNKWGI